MHIRRTTRIVLVSLVIVVAVGAACLWMSLTQIEKWGVGLLHPNSKDTPLMRAYSQLHMTCGKLRHYADEHSTFPGGASTNGSVDSLVSAGILSADDATFLHDHQVEYHGLSLGRSAADVPVFEMVFTNTKTPRRIVSYGDGHTVMSDLETKP